MVTYEQALSATRFRFKITNPRHRRVGDTRTCRRNGKTKTWKTRPGHFRIPVKYGLYEHFYITHENAHEFEPCGFDTEPGRFSDDLAMTVAREVTCP